MKKISIVVPCYNEEDTIPVFYREINKVIADLSEKCIVEVLFIDDGSNDGTLEILRKLRKSDSAVRYLSFSRNFGKEAGIYAGLKYSKGDYVAIMDVDLQDPPQMLIEMYNILEEKYYDCVATRRTTRKGEPVIRSFFAKMFYKLVNIVSKTEIVDGARDYRMMTRKMVDSILMLAEYNRFSKGIFGWVGYRTKWIEYENIERAAGKTKWSFKSLFSYSIDGIVAFSTIPLSIASLIGVAFCILAFFMIVIVVLKTLVFGDPVAGYPSMMCVLLLIGGVQLLSIGVLGKYIEKIYLETKKRPIYIVKEDEKTNREEE